MATPLPVVLVLFAIFASVVFASLPFQQSIRYKEITGSELGDNSVSPASLQDFVVSTDNIKNQAVTNAKLGNRAVNAEQISPDAITSFGLAIDLVPIRIRSNSDTFAQGQNRVHDLPDGLESIKSPSATSSLLGAEPDDNPNPEDDTYLFEGRARGPGIIIGWYPERNGHLLRYQSARALRGLTCFDVDILDHDLRASGAFALDDDDPSNELPVFGTLTHEYISGMPETQDCSPVCTALDGCPEGNNDPYCNAIPANTNDPGQPNSPDRCGRFTNVQDVSNPQEGVPVYSPSLESITISDTGLVQVRFLGAGVGQDYPETGIEIDLTVVVLLREQYGSGPDPL